MRPDVTELMEFYARPLGGMVRRILSHRIRARWRGLKGSTLMGLGFATPYLGAFRGEAGRLGALMPTGQGALIWPPSGPVHTVVVEEDQWPLPDNSVDHLIAVHAIEAAENVRGLLREMWRVLAPEGRLLLIVPNRRGIWARLDHTPFGHGRPYSAGQLERLLADALFTPIEWDAALYMPPIERRMALRSAMTVERLGARMSMAFAGVIIVEARKELEAPVGKVAVRRLPVLVPLRAGGHAAGPPKRLEDRLKARRGASSGTRPSRPGGCAR